MATYYIKNGGNDALDGLSDGNAWAHHPWMSGWTGSATISAGDTVYLNKGDTWHDTITIASSGTLGNVITISSYGTGTDPIISGLTTLSSWSIYSGSIYQATTSSSSQTNMVVVDGTQVGMGRYPNYGTELYINSYTGNTQTQDNEMDESTNWEGAELVLNKVEWITDRCLITDHTDDTFTYTSLGSTYYCYDSRYYFIQNDIRTLTTTNEWYHNQTANTFYIYGNPATKTVQVATVDYLFYNVGYDYITIDGITFQGSIYDAIYSRSSDNIVIQNCTIQYVGRSGLCFYSNDNCTIYNNTIRYANGCGVEAISGDHYSITENNISYIGMIIGQYLKGTSSTLGYVYTTAGTQAIYLNTDTSTDNYVDNNAISYIGLNGIGTSSITKFSATNNFITYCCQVLGDGGGFYCANGSGSRYIDSNIVLYSGVGANAYVSIARGIYIDAGGGNVEIIDNTVANCTEAGYHIHGGDYNTITGNLGYNNGRQIWFQKIVSPVYASNNLVVNHNKFISKSATQYTLYEYGYTSGEILSWGTFDYNYYARPISDTSSLRYLSAAHSLAEWRTLTSQESHSAGSPISISSENDLHFIYNETSDTKYYTLSASMVDVENSSYSGNISLEPWSSLVLIGIGSVTEAEEEEEVFISLNTPIILNFGII